jgi:hypothetical protein
VKRKHTQQGHEREALTLTEHVQLGELLSALSLTAHRLRKTWARALHVHASVPDRLQALVPQHWQRERCTNAYRHPGVGLQWEWMNPSGQLTDPGALLVAVEDAAALLQRCGLKGKRVGGAVSQLQYVRALLRT